MLANYGYKDASGDFSFMARAHLTAKRYKVAAEWARKAVNWRSDAPLPRLMLAACLGHLGMTSEGRAELNACENIRPGFTRSTVIWHPFRHAADEEHFLDGLRKAGWKD